MSVLNRIPKGMLDLFGSISQGKNPPQYVDTVSPTVDIGGLYLGDKLGHYSIDATHSATNNTFIMTQGSNETWLLRGVSVYGVTIATGEHEEWAVALSQPPVDAENSDVSDNPVWIFHSGIMNPVAAAGGVVRAVVFDSPIVMHPGVNLLFKITDRDFGAGRITQLNAMMHLLSA